MRIEAEEGPDEVNLVSPGELDEAQVGYAVDPQGYDLTGGEGDWRQEWLVIGDDALLGDPYFVDPLDTRLARLHGHTWDGPLECAAGRGLLGSVRRDGPLGADRRGERHLLACLQGCG